MRLLVVSDEESSYIWDYFDPRVFAGVDLTLSCGDLKTDYLEFLVSMIPAPLFYVPGNHDKRFLRREPDGCVNADGQILCYRGLRVLGLGGCKSPRPALHEYTEQAMAKRVDRLSRPIKKSNGFDILLTHAPALGLGDGKDLFHQGFACFLPLIDRYAPKYHFYGHQHKRYDRDCGAYRRGATLSRNACGYILLDF